MWSTSRRVPWKARVRGDRCRAPRRSASARARARPSALSTTSAAAPMPMIIPWRRWSNGSAASSTTSSVAAAPEARKPAPSQPSSVSEVASSAATTTTRRQRPARIQSSASATACVVLAHAELICVFGPARADQLGELRVAHRQHAEQEAPVERRTARSSSWRLEVVDAAVDLGEHDGVGAVVVEHARAQRLQRGQALAAHAVGRVARRPRRSSPRGPGRPRRRSRRCRRAARRAATSGRAAGCPCVVVL